METRRSEQIYAFDSLYTTNHIQMLKILLPCLHPPLQKNLALYIKFLELRYTISFLNAHPYVISGCGFSKKYGGQDLPIDDLLPYLTPKEADHFRQLQKTMDIMKQFSNMQKNMEALQGILPEGMDLESLFQGMMGGMHGFDTGNSKQKDVDRTSQPFKDMEKPDFSNGDVLKNMMNDSQKELYEKFNERFRNL